MLHAVGHARMLELGTAFRRLLHAVLLSYCHKYVNHRYAGSFVHHSAVLSCLQHDLHKTVITKWGADTSGCVHASSESPGSPINITNPYFLSLFPLLWLIPFSTHLK